MLSRLGSGLLLGSWLASCSAGDPSQEDQDANIETTSGALSASQVEPLGPSADWTSSTAAGSIGTFFGDVTGGSTNAMDLILVNSNNIQVRRSPGASPLNSATTWSSTPFFGSVMTRFADVNNDNRVDAIQVNSGNIRVRRSTGTSFNTTQETWSSTGFTGSVGTFFADVTGDKRADAIAVNSNGILVRRSTGSAFSSSVETWSTATAGSSQFRFADVTGDGRADAVISTPSALIVRRAPASGAGPFGPEESWANHGLVGTRDNLFADVTGDGLADYVAVNDTNIRMRRSGQWFFGPWETLSTTGGGTGLAARALADFTGDNRVDYIEVPTSGAVRVRARQDRRIPLRFVELAPDCGSGNLVSDAQIDKIINDVNAVYRDAGLFFYAETPVGAQDCGARARSQVSLSSSFASLVDQPAMPLSELAKAVRFAPGCNLGVDAIQSVPAKEQLGWALARCGRSKEIVVYVGLDRSSGGNAPGWGKVLLLHPSDANGLSNSWPILAHEIGHYLGLPHVHSDETRYPTEYTDPLTGKAAPLSMFWDLVLSTSSNPPATFTNRADAQAQEFSLRSIDDINTRGWHCPSANPMTQPCPPPPHAPGTLRIPAGGSGGPLWDSGDVRLSGLSMRNPGSAGGFATNIMAYGYPGDSQSSFLPQRLSLSQIEIIQNSLANDIVTRFLAVNGAPTFGHRSALGTDDPPQQMKFVMTGAVAKSGPGTLATNGVDTWVVGTNAYDGDGNQAWQFEPRTGGWYAYPMGAQQVAVPSDETRTAANVSPWAIVTSGQVKRYNGSTFVEPPNGANFCARSLALGPLSSQKFQYAWAIGCNGNGNGDFQLYRYRHVDGVGGWVGTAIWGRQVTVDGNGKVWVLRANGTVNGIFLDSSDMPLALSPYPAPGGGTPIIAAGGYRNSNLPPTALGNDGHLHILSYSPTQFSWFDTGATPVAFDRIAGSIPYLWALQPDGRVWYLR